MKLGAFRARVGGPRRYWLTKTQTPVILQTVGGLGKESMTQRAIDGPFLYFVTTNTTFRSLFFDTPERAASLATIIHDACKEYRFDLLGYAILPDHVHLLVLKSGHETLSRLMKRIKGRFWRTQSGNRFWQPRFNFRIIEDEDRFASTVEYIRRNYQHHDLNKRFGQTPFVNIYEDVIKRISAPTARV